MDHSDLMKLTKDRVFYHFVNLCSIPRKSFHEKQLSDFLLNWAKELGLYAIQDEHLNVTIKKNATLGYENVSPIILQAHIDMVCEKIPEYKHDFFSDAIPLQIDGDILSTGGKTTLGADNGIGVAMAMAILEDKAAHHPALEVLFTTAEEEDLSGALGIDTTKLLGHRLVNIDHAVEDEIIAGSCGGTGVELKLNYTSVDVPQNYMGYRIKISGLPGGHSGEDIHRGRGNANILLGRILHEYQSLFEFMLGEISGGSFRLAIPRDAFATVFISPKHKISIDEITIKVGKLFKEELKIASSNLAVELTTVALSERAVSPKDVNRFIMALSLSPDGISTMSAGVEGAVESSCNLGEIHSNDNEIMFVYEIRASFESQRDYIAHKIRMLANVVGGEYRGFAEYPGWVYEADSPLRSLVEKTYRKLYDKDMKTLVVHAGLECGCFFPKIKDLDAICIGPNIYSMHSPLESVDISSVKRVYRLLMATLEDASSF